MNHSGIRSSRNVRTHSKYEGICGGGRTRASKKAIIENKKRNTRSVPLIAKSFPTSWSSSSSFFSYYYSRILFKMCWKQDCSSCGKPSWAGWGKHIEMALDGVAIEDRCPGWQTGKCTSGGGVAETKCSCCGEAFSAQTSERLQEVMAMHYELSEGKCQAA